jgi:DNA processing protein
LARKFEEFRESFSLQSYHEQLQSGEVLFLTLQDSDYPKRLKAIPNPPFVLFVKGNHHFNDKYYYRDVVISVVGTRKVTMYGEEVTRIFTRELVDAGCTVVSGLALGVDAIAHGVTVSNKGTTIAVLGCGVDCCYPLANKQLYERIITSGGAVVSEYALGVPVSNGSFPSRNRIIAGLSDAVLVTEGAEDSGSLITAKYAFQFGRRVFAVPGPVTSSLSRGPLKLIQKGAKLVTNGEEILKELPISNLLSKKLSIIGGRSQMSNRNIKGETKEEQIIINLLQNEPLHFDEIVKRTKGSSSQIGTLLSLMEIKGILYLAEGKYRLAT